MHVHLLSVDVPVAMHNFAVQKKCDAHLDSGANHLRIITRHAFYVWYAELYCYPFNLQAKLFYYNCTIKYINKLSSLELQVNQNTNRFYTNNT